MIAVRTFQAASSTCRILPLNRWELSDEESRRSNLTLFTRVGEASQLPERAQGKTRSGGASLGPPELLLNFGRNKSAEISLDYVYRPWQRRISCPRASSTSSIRKPIP